MATFGQTGDNAGSTTSSADSNIVNKAADAESTPATNGTLDAVVARVWVSGTGSTVAKGVIYDASGNLLATGDETSITNNTEQAVTFPFSGAQRISLTAGTKYAYGIHFRDPGTDNMTWSRQATSNATWKNSDNYADGPQNPLGSGTVSGPVDMYVSYTESGGGTEYDEQYTETITITATAIKNPGKVLSQTVTISGSLLKTLGRFLSQTITITSNALKTPGRTLNQTVTTTDTLLKLPGKVLSQTLTTTDTVLKVGGKVLSQTLTITDSVLKTAGRILSQTITSTDSVLKSTARSLLQTVTTSDSVLKTPGHVLNQAITLTDTILRTPGKVLSQVITTTDSIIRGASKVLNQTITITGNWIRTTSRTISESFSLQDVFARVVTITRVYTQTVTISDVFNTIQGKVFSEVLSIGESLLARILGAKWYTRLRTVFGTLFNSVWNNRNNTSYKTDNQTDWYNKNNTDWQDES